MPCSAHTRTRTVQVKKSDLIFLFFSPITQSPTPLYILNYTSTRVKVVSVTAAIASSLTKPFILSCLCIMVIGVIFVGTIVYFYENWMMTEAFHDHWQDGIQESVCASALHAGQLHGGVEHVHALHEGEWGCVSCGSCLC